MCCVPHQPSAASATSAPLRAFQSLSDAQARELEVGMAAIPGSWEIDCQESYDGHLTLIITAADVTPGLLFAVWRDGADLQLSTMKDDEQVAVQAFISVRAVLLAIRSFSAPKSHSLPVPAAAHLRLV